MNIGLIVDQPILNYALGVVSRNLKIKLEMLCYSERIDDGSLENLIVRASDQNSICCDALVIVAQNSEQIRGIISRLLFFELNNDKIKLVVVRPSCINANSDFIINNEFDQEKIIELPFSEKAIGFLSERLHAVISPKTIAKDIYKTNDNIEAYLIENIHLRILSFGYGIIGCMYTDDGAVLDSWTNGRKHFYSKVEEAYIPSDSDNVINVDNVCPLVRVWAENYFHFTTEVFDKILVTEELGFTGKYMLRHSSDAKDLTMSIGISDERVIWIEPDDIGKVFLIRNVFDVEGFTAGTQMSTLRLCNKGSDIATELVRGENTQYARMLYVPRTGRRKLLGVEEIIKEFNFYTFIPEEHSLEEEIKYFNNADIILCPHGAATANIVFMKKGAALIETCPCDWSEGSAVTFLIAKVRDVIYRQIVEPTRVNHVEPSGQFRDYRVNNSLLAYTIRELKKCIEATDEYNTQENDADIT